MRGATKMSKEQSKNDNNLLHACMNVRSYGNVLNITKRTSGKSRGNRVAMTVNQRKILKEVGAKHHAGRGGYYSIERPAAKTVDLLMTKLDGMTYEEINLQTLEDFYKLA